MAKGWITAEDVAKAKEIKEKVAAEKAANLPEAMIEISQKAVWVNS